MWQSYYGHLYSWTGGGNRNIQSSGYRSSRVITAGDMNALWNSPLGGRWDQYSGLRFFKSEAEAMFAACLYNNYHNSWGSTSAGSRKGALAAYKKIKSNGGRGGASSQGGSDLLASLDGAGSPQGDGDEPRKEGGNAFSWSATLAIGPVGFTLETGVVTDNNNGANTFFSAGFAAGYEASFQFNYYWIFGPFSTSDWAGVSYNADIGKGFIAGGGGANAGHLTDTEYFPLSYSTAKAAYGPAFGVGSGNRSVTVLGNIKVVDIIPFYPPTPW